MGSKVVPAIRLERRRIDRSALNQEQIRHQLLDHLDGVLAYRDVSDSGVATLTEAAETLDFEDLVAFVRACEAELEPGWQEFRNFVHEESFNVVIDLRGSLSA